MKLRTRKEVTMVTFEGVALDGGFVFTASTSNVKDVAAYGITVRGKLPCEEKIFTMEAYEVQFEHTRLKLMSYADGVAEIAIGCQESIARVAEIVAGMFSKYSNFYGLNCVILNYKNISLKISKTTGRKNIIAMMMKVMNTSGYQSNDITVDTTVQDIPEEAEKMQFMGIPEWYLIKKVLRFKSSKSQKSIYLAEIRNGVITPDFTTGGEVYKIIEEVKKLFRPLSNMYGIKEIELNMNHFEYRMDKDSDVGKVHWLFKRAISIDTELGMKSIEEFIKQTEEM